MIGIAELGIIAIIAAVLFFGKGQVLGWAKTLGQVKTTYTGELDGNHKIK